MRYSSENPGPRARRTAHWGWFRLALLAACLFLAGCERSKTEFRHGVAVVVPTISATWIRNFNPFFATQARWPTPAGIYEPLVVYNRIKHEYVPWLATSHRWENGNRDLVMTIRRGVKWSDGTPMSAEDVRFTWQLMKRHPALDQGAMWTRLYAVEQRGDEIVFRFKEPFVPGLFFIGESPVVPKHIWAQIQDPIRYANESPVGTGPFTEVRSFKTQVYELGRNPHYWQEGRPYLEAIRVQAYPGNEQASLALIRGEVDWGAVFLPAIDRIFVAKDPAHRGYHFPEIEGVVMLYPNHTRAPFDQLEVRKALSHGIDRDRIVRIAMQGYVRKADATGLSKLYSKYHSKQVLEEEGDFTRYDPDLAERMLDAAGLPRGADGWRTLPSGQPLRVDLNCVVGWSDWLIAAQIIVKNLEELGITTRLRTYDFGAWFHRLQTGEFDLSLGWSAGGPTLYTFYGRQMSRTTYRPIGDIADHNWQRYQNEEADALLDQLARTSDGTEQLRLSHALQRVFVQNAPALPLFPGPAFGEYVSTRIVGFPDSRDPYTALAPYKTPGNLLALVNLRPRDVPADGAPLDLPRDDTVQFEPAISGGGEAP